MKLHPASALSQHMLNEIVALGEASLCEACAVTTFIETKTSSRYQKHYEQLCSNHLRRTQRFPSETKSVEEEVAAVVVVVAVEEEQQQPRQDVVGRGRLEMFPYERGSNLLQWLEYGWIQEVIQRSSREDCKIYFTSRGQTYLQWIIYQKVDAYAKKSSVNYCSMVHFKLIF
ncbi:hypothetical protein RB195_020234 [Necator americanus]|uniref:Uncharacterized protein n=1 Tax=Necator americanus TaxID=51031 RepID=A0ABR1CID5_NECAM